MKATEIAKKASELVGGDRDRQHGDKHRNFAGIAAVWNGILKASGKLGKELDAKDVAVLMAGLKLARMYSGEFNVDDATDACGYAACAGEIGSSSNVRPISSAA